ncbi:hypothetical protein VNI00_004645 [Paramarasmius palmivorus]|uniref:Uncharacterized protein n=1 Tax=Paramarasmius palmivorus TaxID=297713 RepID=A0AAW0DKY8_9AGAR
MSGCLDLMRAAGTCIPPAETPRRSRTLEYVDVVGNTGETALCIRSQEQWTFQNALPDIVLSLVMSATNWTCPKGTFNPSHRQIIGMFPFISYLSNRTERFHLRKRARPLPFVLAEKTRLAVDLLSW